MGTTRPHKGHVLYPIRNELSQIQERINALTAKLETFGGEDAQGAKEHVDDIQAFADKSLLLIEERTTLDVTIVAIARRIKLLSASVPSDDDEVVVLRTRLKEFIIRSVECDNRGRIHALDIRARELVPPM